MKNTESCVQNNEIVAFQVFKRSSDFFLKQNSLEKLVTEAISVCGTVRVREDFIRLEKSIFLASSLVQVTSVSHALGYTRE